METMTGDLTVYLSEARLTGTPPRPVVARSRYGDTSGNSNSSLFMSVFTVIYSENVCNNGKIIRNRRIFILVM